jgi:hypothetical protein
LQGQSIELLLNLNDLDPGLRSYHPLRTAAHHRDQVVYYDAQKIIGELDMNKPALISCVALQIDGRCAYRQNKDNRFVEGYYRLAICCFHAGILLGFFDPKDGSEIFLRNVG